MKKSLLLITLLLAGAASAETVVKLNGFAGADVAIVNDLLNKIVNPTLARDGIRAVFEPFQGDFNAALTNALSSGTAGDLVYIDLFVSSGFIKTGKLLPLNGKLDTRPFVPSLIKAFSEKNKVYAIAKDFNSLAITYNKDLFDEAGVAYPDDKDTWTSFSDKLRKVKKALGNEYYGICLPADFARFGAFAFATGWKVFDSKGNSNLLDPRFKQAFNFYTGLVKDKTAVLPSDLSQGWSGGCFGGGKVAAALEGAWISGFLRDSAPNLKYGTAPVPRNDKTKKRGNFLYTVGWAVNKDSKNQAAALKVLEQLTSEKTQQFILTEGLAIPSRTSLQNNPYFSKTTQEAQNARIVFQGASDGYVYGYNFGQYGGDWMNPVNAALQAVMSGKATTDEALKKAQTDLNAVMKR